MIQTICLFLYSIIFSISTFFGLRTDSEYYILYKWIFRGIFIIGTAIILLSNPKIINDIIKNI